jgi:hypothetical protein
MSKKKTDSKANAKSSGKKDKKLKIAKIKPPKTRKDATKSILKDKTQVQLKKVGSKTLSIGKKIKGKIRGYYETLKNQIINREIYVKGEEPPKSYAFEKKFYGFYLIFIFYSFVLLLGINDPSNLLFIIFMFGNPFAFASAILFFLLTMSVLLNIDKIRLYIFEKNTLIKQPIIFGVMITFYYLLYLYFASSINIISFLLFLSLIWLFLLSSRYYTLSRKTSTKIESRFISKYSPLRYFIALISPFIIATLLVLISLYYRSMLVFVALDFFAEEDPTNALRVYNFAMRVVMPLIYFSLVITIVFIVIEFVATRRKAETRRAGCYDNLTFSLIVLFIFGFQILQITIFLLLRPETITALKNSLGTTGTGFVYLFLVQYAVSMIFLYRIIIKMGGAFNWRILFFKRDGLILFFLCCIYADSLIAFTLASQVQNQELTIIGTMLLANRYIISVLMIIFLGVTLLLYYMKPHETSMFIRMQKETVKEEEENITIIYKLLKNEYIRRGEPYPLEIMERELIKSTKLPKGELHSLIRRLSRVNVDIDISRRKDKSGQMVDLVDFFSVTEQFDKKDVAEKKAKAFISRKLIESISKEKRKTIRLAKNLDENKASDQLISSLSTGYTKRKEKEEELKTQKETQKISFTKKEIPPYLKFQIFDVVKKEYIYRIENPDTYAEYEYPISQIVNQISLATRITIGEIYQILERVSRSDLELKLVRNPEEPKDKNISFFPIADDEICHALANFRPNDYLKIKAEITKKLVPLIKHRSSNSNLINIKRKVPHQNETQKSWRELIDNLAEYYSAYSKELLERPSKTKLRNIINKLKK